MSEIPLTDDAGRDCCIDCEQPFGGSNASLGVNATFGPVYDTNGTRYEVVVDSEGGTPLLHEECWEQREIDRKATENESLGVWLE